MKKLTLVMAALMLAACGREKADDFRAGVPSADAVKLNVPAKGGQALESEELGSSAQALQGQTSDFYQLTRGVTVGVNGATVFILRMLKAITDHQPTSLNGDTAVWGPHTEALSPNTWKLTVTRVSATEYSYKLEGKAKQAADTEYKTVLSGTHRPTLDANGDPQEHFHSGDFLLDWDQAKLLPEHDDNVGKAQFTYSRVDAAADIKIDVVFTQVKDKETGKLVDAQYKYLQKPNQDGEFEFGIEKNLDGANAQRAAVERLTIKSRWVSTGQGRADIKATGGDLATAATVNECWDANFISQFQAASWAPAEPTLNYGAEATACGSFTSASYSTL